MNLITLITEDIYFFIFSLILLPFLCHLMTFFSWHKSSKRSQPLPPGPFSWPIIGNAFLLGKLPHVTLAKLTQIHGPLIMLKNGSQPFIVGSSPAAAREILRTKDRMLSGRLPPPKSPPSGIAKLHNMALVFMDECGDEWRRVRGIYRADFFSSKALDSHAELRENKVKEMIDYLGSKKLGEVVRIKEVVFVTALNILSNTMFGNDFIDYEGKGVAKGLRNDIRSFGAMGFAAPRLSDLYMWDSKGFVGKLMGIFERMCAVWGDFVREHRNKRSTSGFPGRQDFADILIQSGFTDAQINTVIMELFNAGTESTSATSEWMLTELIRNPEAMKKLREEIQTVVANNLGETMVRDSDLPCMSYLEACLKETLRLHPPGPLLLPHVATEDCQVMGYAVPKGSQVTVNMWAIGRDPDIWGDHPLKFSPDRFMQSKIDYMGNYFEYIPFGSGRRMCPGQPLASKVVPLIVANLIHHFDWALPKGMNPKVDIDMTDLFDITMQKKECLCAIPKSRN